MPRIRRMAGLKPKQYFREFWALRDVSFEVKKGETVGIIGRNGSGKSTLLQMICGTLNPSSGSITGTGRISALLELGSGFNPEFTGRENVYMNAAVLGLDKEEIDARFDGIAAFADIGDFIEQPVKTFSSGMVVRLAFSVAINVDPEILIVDEALSVGDELFQRKCFSRIESIRKNGATILLVSHSVATIVELCDRAILIDSGEVLSDGAPKNVIANYQKLLYAPAEKRAHIKIGIKSQVNSQSLAENDRSIPSIVQNVSKKNKLNDGASSFYDQNLKPQSTIYYESIGARIVEPVVLTVAGDVVNHLKSTEPYIYRYKVMFDQSAANVRFGMLIKSTTGVQLGGGVSPIESDELRFVDKGTVIDVFFSFDCNLNPDIYYLNAGVVGCLESEEVILHRILDACVIKVLPIEDNTSTAFVNFNCGFSADFICGGLKSAT